MKRTANRIKIIILVISILFPSVSYILLFLIPDNVFLGFLYLYSPIILLLTLLPFKDRLLAMDEIDLYAGISSKTMFIGPLLTIDEHLSNFYYRVAFYLSGYGPTNPFELYLSLFITRFLIGKPDSIIQSSSTYKSLSAVISIMILSLYLITLFWKREHLSMVLKILFMASMAMNIVLILYLVSPRGYTHGFSEFFLIMLQLLYFSFNAYRLSKVQSQWTGQQ